MSNDWNTNSDSATSSTSLFPSPATRPAESALTTPGPASTSSSTTESLDLMPSLTSSSGSESNLSELATSNEISYSSLGRRFSVLGMGGAGEGSVLGEGETEEAGEGEHVQVVEPLPGQIALDISVEDNGFEFVNFEAWLAGNRWIVDNDNTETDDEETQANNVPESKRPEE